MIFLYSICIYKNIMDRMIKELSNDWETKQFLKKKYMDLKIQEAKDKKGISQFEWDLLPSEVEEKILMFKYQADLEYIPRVLKENKIYNKTFQKWFFSIVNKEMGNFSIPKIKNDNITLFICNMINNKSLWQKCCYSGWKTDEKAFKLFMKDKETLSFEQCIEYNKKDLKEQKEKRKERQKKQEEQEEKLNDDYKLKIQDIIFCGRGISNNDNYELDKFYRIIDETKTMWRVRMCITLEELLPLAEGDYYRNTRYTYDGDDMTKKTFNISKKRVGHFNKFTEFTTRNVFD